MIGRQAGDWSTPLTTGSHNLHIGYATAGSSATVSNECVITLGNDGATGKGQWTGYFENFDYGIYQHNNSADWDTTSDRRIKKNIVDNNTGLDAINQIRVRNFEYKTPDEIDELPKEAAVKQEGTQLGVIAQEIQLILPDVVKEESTGCYSVDPDNIKWYMINAIKELSEENDKLKEILDA